MLCCLTTTNNNIILIVHTCTPMLVYIFIIIIIGLVPGLQLLSRSCIVKFCVCMTTKVAPIQNNV